MAIIPKPFREARFGPPRPNAKQRALAEWRGIDLTGAEGARPRVKKAGDVLPAVLTNMRFDSRRSEAEVIRVWNHLLDPTIVAHAQPVRLVKGTLFVAVDSSPWLNEIVRYRRKEILTRLQHSFGRDFITKISFRIG